MSSIFRRAWSDYVQPLLGRPDRFQVAALCYRRQQGRLEILLISSLHTGRWIIPKGWPMKGRDAAEAAAAEAWEEAGAVIARVNRTPIGSYRYTKVFRGGAGAACETTVFPMRVETLADEYPQKGRRERAWVTPEEAADAVDEPGLRDILLSLAPDFSSD
jgi:8-oxo-dGTP pyrophosphatase MutT (NUDIX family)